VSSFEATTIWQSAFAGKSGDQYSEERSFLRGAFLKFRERVSLLVSVIAKDLPDLTVHDISHLDALWETASLIAGSNYHLTPCEAFVLGGAILLHDAGMSLASYPTRLPGLKDTVEWRDAIASAMRSAGYESDLSTIKVPPEIERHAIAEVLRLRHAHHASELATQKWTSPDGNEEYLIEDSDLRKFYGPTIGAIARSHWDSVQSLETKLPKLLGAISKLPAEWKVDPVKIACLLRVADAAHIDDRRAPHFLRTIVRPQGISDEHWGFQDKLAQAQAQGDALVFTSGPEFTIQYADAWWRCFDTIQMIDAELKAVDILLESLHKPQFALRRVMAAESPRNLAQYVRTRGWEPVDARLVISDVPRVIRVLGGKHLYGDDPKIAVRELIQNAADAIRARRILLKDPEFGRIVVRRQKIKSSTWLEVEDDGIGMSERVLTGSLLDFGNSFWRGTIVREEFPGLIAGGMQPTGKFGVGFFSVFMLGNVVTVTSRRFDQAAESARTLEFRGGLDARPILREPSPDEAMPNGGTRVSVKLAEKREPERDLHARRNSLHEAPITSLASLVAGISPDIDVDIDIETDGKTRTSVRSNDWISIPSERLLKRVSSLSSDEDEVKVLRTYASAVRELRDSDGQIYGRPCIAPRLGIFEPWECAVTVGGLVATRIRGLAGVLIGSTESVARNIAMPSSRSQCWNSGLRSNRDF
jgi:histidine kinase/DNA gyrase B/HSP90-like ATPase